MSQEHMTMPVCFQPRKTTNTDRAMVDPVAGGRKKRLPLCRVLLYRSM
jgi:hypothetical protein